MTAMSSSIGQVRSGLGVAARLSARQHPPTGTDFYWHDTVTRS